LKSEVTRHEKVIYKTLFATIYKVDYVSSAEIHL